MPPSSSDHPPTAEPAGGFFQHGLDYLSNLGVGVKINMVLVTMGLFPPLAGLLLLQGLEPDRLRNVMALYIAVILALYYPLAKAMEEWIVLRQTRRINAYVEEVKAGRRTPNFNPPMEQGAEHDFRQLQRNIFWMVQGLNSRESRLQEALVKLEQARRQAEEALEYAGLIQRAVLPSRAELHEALGDHFLLWRPRDGVGGDAYWLKRAADQSLLAVFDCTGHGVPGALLALIAFSLFEQNYDESCLADPGRLLSRMNLALAKALSNRTQGYLSSDGLEGAVCCLDRHAKVLRFAGARSNLFLVGREEISEHRGDRRGVGFADVPPDREFTNQTFALRDVDAVYLLTDGVIDQIGGPKRLPFGRRRIREWMAGSRGLSLADQLRDLEQVFADYKGPADQRDDVTVLGFSTKEQKC
ncbi:MAG: SpoIIE family protein phosphatase [Pseudomonadota bacterium]